LYFEKATRTLRWRRASSADGRLWSDPVVLSPWGKQAGQWDDYFEGALVDGRPAVLFDERVHGELMFVAANDASGSYWGFPSAVPHLGTLGLTSIVNGFAAATCDLRDIAGHAAVAYSASYQDDQGQTVSGAVYLAYY
jgi:hypothetical protein